MKRTTFQVIFAEDWLAKIWIGGIVTSVVLALGIFFLPTFAVLGVSIDSAGLILGILLIGVAAYCVSFPLGSCILPPIYRWREHLNGAPFEDGDEVEVLKRPNRGRRTQVVAAGTPQYGMSVSFPEDDSDPLNLAWHSVRKLTKKPNKAVNPTADRL